MYTQTNHMNQFKPLARRPSRVSVNKVDAQFVARRAWYSWRAALVDHWQEAASEGVNRRYSKAG